MTTIVRLVALFVLLTAVALPQQRAHAENNRLEQLATELDDYADLADASVMVLGTFHFDAAVLDSEAQQSLQALLETLAVFAPTKIVLEWEPSQQSYVDEAFSKYTSGDFDLSERHNEVYQLGFRLGKRLGHDRLYLFDDQTEFIGSLEGFTFDALTDYAKRNDAGFFDKHMASIADTFGANKTLFEAQSLYDEIALRNSPRAQRSNARRMHMLELRVGVGKNWLGPDWLGRWYRRNVRMASLVLRMAEPGDRLLIVVGDNHKWVLDFLFEQMPDFDVASSWALLTQRQSPELHAPAKDD